MANRKAIETELNRFESLANRLEHNLKSVTQTLVNERNHLQKQHEIKKDEVVQLNTQNVELKAINGCMSHQQKMYEKYAFKNHDQSMLAKIMEAAKSFAGDRANDAVADGHRTPRTRDSTPSTSFHAPPAAANDEVVNLDDEDAASTREQ